MATNVNYLFDYVTISPTLTATDGVATAGQIITFNTGTPVLTPATGIAVTGPINVSFASLTLTAATGSAIVTSNTTTGIASATIKLTLRPTYVLGNDVPVMPNPEGDMFGSNTPAYVKGAQITASVSFTNVAGQLVDPSTVVFKWKRENGTETVLTYGTDPYPVKDATGVYHVVFTPTVADNYVTQWVTTGLVAVAEKKFIVVPSNF